MHDKNVVELAIVFKYFNQQSSAFQQLPHADVAIKLGYVSFSAHRAFCPFGYTLYTHKFS